MLVLARLTRLRFAELNVTGFLFLCNGGGINIQMRFLPGRIGLHISIRARWIPFRSRISIDKVKVPNGMAENQAHLQVRQTI
jgi:hypothetical protein